jgi:hypothetical protein
MWRAMTTQEKFLKGLRRMDVRNKIFGVLAVSPEKVPPFLLHPSALFLCALRPGGGEICS